MNGIGSHLTEKSTRSSRGWLKAEETISKKKKKFKKTRGAVNGVAVIGEKTKPVAKVRDYESHVFVCAGGDCKKRGAKGTRKALKQEIRSGGILAEARIDNVDCLGLCEHGPNVVVYDKAQPKGTWYLGLTEDDVPEVVEQHLKNGEPVEHLTAERRPRKAGKTKN